MRKRALMKNEKGFSIIEVTIAIALLGVIAVAFLSGLAAASKAIFIADERATAESLVRSQMEDVKNQDYITAAVGGEVTYAEITTPAGYTIWSVNRAGDTVEDIIGVPWDTDPLVNQPVVSDAGLQRIKLIIKHHDKEILALEDYKVDR